MATRQFRLLGSLTSDAIATGTITINEVEVYNGTLNSVDGTLAEGSADINDSAEITLPVSIFIASGDVLVGPLHWNYGQVENPLLTSEERSYIVQGVFTDTGEIITPAHIAPLVPPEIKESIAAKGGFFVKSETVFTAGDTDELRNSNTSNLKINGSAVDGPNWYHYLVPAGSTLTYNVTISSRS